MTDANGSMRPRRLRCAIYTRKSSDEGLEQDFNSLDAQREACEAYILSQKHGGWTALPEMYDDGGISGATIERPSLQRLLADVRSGKVDCVVVYKVDRLTRSLADFAKIVEIFDASSVSFVSVTQQFNTTTSMGRLTLNVLLSFAQFEREIAGERIRDKIAASKRKGMWMGGLPPLGYEVRERKLVIVDREAETVRHIFQRYLALGSVFALREDLMQDGITSKLRVDQHGRTTGGKPFARGALYHMLKNRIYLGEIVHKGASYPGEHTPIVDQTLWDAVAKQLQENAHDHKNSTRAKDPSLLSGIIFDGEGGRLTPSHANKAGRRYRYYVSECLIRGPRSGSPNGRRLPARDVEDVVLNAIAKFLQSGTSVLDALSTIDMQISKDQAVARSQSLAKDWQHLPSSMHKAFVRRLVQRVVFHADRIDLDIDRHQVHAVLNDPELREPIAYSRDRQIRDSYVVTVDASLKRAGQGMRIVVHDAPAAKAPSAALVNLFVKAFEIRDKILNGNGESIEVASERIKVNANYVTALLRISFLAPDIVEAVLDGRHPVTLTARNFSTKTHLLPRAWSLQRRHLGF